MTGRRTGWDQLGEAQRRRYVNRGLTRAEYERGISLAAYRGHAKTPERPERAFRLADVSQRYYDRNWPKMLAWLQGTDAKPTPVHYTQLWDWRHGKPKRDGSLPARPRFAAVVPDCMAKFSIAREKGAPDDAAPVLPVFASPKDVGTRSIRHQIYEGVEFVDMVSEESGLLPGGSGDPAIVMADPRAGNQFRFPHRGRIGCWNLAVQDRPRSAHRRRAAS